MSLYVDVAVSTTNGPRFARDAWRLMLHNELDAPALDEHKKTLGHYVIIASLKTRLIHQLLNGRSTLH
jgi:hypothetical protein